VRAADDDDDIAMAMITVVKSCNAVARIEIDDPRSKLMPGIWVVLEK